LGDEFNNATDGFISLFERWLGSGMLKFIPGEGDTSAPKNHLIDS
jgi:hypothetical protein